MNKLQILLTSAKENKGKILRGTAVVLGASVGLAIGMDLMNRAVDSAEDALDPDDEVTDSED